jgi:hypothetical protein
VKEAAHPSFLPSGRGEKTGSATAFYDEMGAQVATGVLRWGGKEEGAQEQLYPEKKVARGVLGAPLTVEWVVMVEAVEASVIGRLLTVSSCTNGEKVVRGDRHGRWEWRAAAYRGGVAAASDRGGRNARGFIPHMGTAIGTTSGGQWDASGGRHCH